MDVHQAAIDVVANIPVKRDANGDPIEMMLDEEDATVVVDVLLEHGLLES
jgi:hypothetical protein